VRDSSSWRKDLLADLRRASFPEEVMSADSFCAVELGLYFLTRYFSGEPVGVLQPLLSGYVADRSLDAEIRRVRHRMGDVARRGYWRRLLNHYMRVPREWRCFDRTDDPRRRVSDQTVFVSKLSSYCPERTEVYAAALSEPLQYVRATRHPPAEAGKRYWFGLPGGRVEYVRLPEVLPLAPPIDPLPVVTARTRQPWTISFVKDLEPTAKWIDEQLADRPDITNRNWEKRLKEDMRFSAVDPASPTLIDQPEDFIIDGIAHIVGLMNSGKTTLADLITVDRVRVHGNRVCLVVSSVGDVFNKVSFLRTLGIEAVPLIGRSSRAEHSARYWRTVVEEAAVLIPDNDTPPDPAAGYANASCLLEPFRRSSAPSWAPLSPNEFPCHGRLREAEADSPRSYDCPLLSICPAQKAYREIVTAQVWVTTPQCLVASRAEPHAASVRWFEAAQGHIDLMIIDEADAVQQVLDNRFVQTEPLASTDKGWTYRMVGYTNEAMAAQDLAPTADPEVWRWYEQLQVHEQAVFTLNRLALSPEGGRLKELLGDKPFTAHSLFRQVARTLFGLSRHSGDDDKATEDLAEDFYRQHLQDFAESPHEVPGHGLNLVVAEITKQIRNDGAVTNALDAWIDKNVSTRHVTHAWLERERPLLRLVIEAAIWAGRISTSFFEMATMYPSVRERLRLPDEETFWADQPPRDYRPLVPEAPMGNILALRWAASRNGGASLQLLWVHGVGRWLLHHAHDLLACEGIQGPHVMLTSATSWAPGSSFYHVPITPTAVLLQRDADRAALRTSTMAVQPMKAGADAIFVSGRYGKQRDDALRQMVTALCLPADGRHRSVIDELRAQLPPDRRQILFVVLSGREAQIVGDHINNRMPQLRARVVVPDAADPGRDGILRRLVGSFGRGTDDILVAAELSIQRGYNILNANDTAALGAVVYLTRSHPPPFDLAFPLSLVSQLAIKHLQQPPEAPPGQVAELVQQLRGDARKMWFDVIGRPVQFRAIAPAYRLAFVANNLVPMSQTTGRSIRGNQPTRVLLCDAAFAPRLATGDSALDTQRTSIVVATDALLTTLLAPPGEAADAEQLRLHAINQAVWGLMGHLICTNEPLGSQRKTSR
jgi:pPIWI RE three-gene island domain Z